MRASTRDDERDIASRDGGPARIRLPTALDVFDAGVESALAPVRGGRADHAAHLLSSLADRSLLWVVLAALRAARRRPGDLRAAARMVAVVGAQSGVVHFLVKPRFERRRPTVEVILRYRARRPPSSSFPSGHAASATAAAVLLAEGTPWALPLGALATGVVWSRVHTGLHHASDVIAGAALGLAVGRIARRLLPLPGAAR